MAHVEPFIRRDLVIAAAACMEPRPRLADAFRQTRLDVHMDVFEGDGEIEIAVVDVLFDVVEAGDDFVGVILRYNALLGKHFRMGLAALDIERVQTSVVGNGFAEFLDE